MLKQSPSGGTSHLCLVLKSSCNCRKVSSVLLSKTCEKCFEWCFPSHLKIPRVNIAHNACIVLLLSFWFKIKHPRVSLLISSLPSEIVVSVKWNLLSDVSFDKRNNFVTAFTWVEVLSTRKMEQRYIPVETMMSILRTTSKDFDPENIGENPM